jgi:hypothetical protein
MDIVAEIFYTTIEIFVANLLGPIGMSNHKVYLKPILLDETNLHLLDFTLDKSAVNVGKSVTF